VSWIYLVGAILLEVAGTAALRVAVGGSRRWYVAVGVAYVAAFGFLQLALSNGLALGVAYGTWAAAGVVLTAIVSKVLFKEPLTWVMGGGMALIVGGVLIIELGAAH
jgi:small multidrug resistance pump